jgi:hypothetical protein
MLYVIGMLLQMILPLPVSERVRRQRLADYATYWANRNNPQKGGSDNPDKRHYHCMTPETDYLLVTAMTVCTRRLFAALLWISSDVAPIGERTRTATAPSCAMPITLPTELTEGQAPKCLTRIT